jgi:hypothetical protein
MTYPRTFPRNARRHPALQVLTPPEICQENSPWNDANRTHQTLLLLVANDQCIFWRELFRIAAQCVQVPFVDAAPAFHFESNFTACKYEVNFQTGLGMPMSFLIRGNTLFRRYKTLPMCPERTQREWCPGQESNLRPSA